MWADPYRQGARVLILVNDGMKRGTGTGATVSAGEYYAGKRGIPKTNILHLTTIIDEAILYPGYVSQVEKPVTAFLEGNGGAMKRWILDIIPTYGIPVKANRTGNVIPAVDLLLAGMDASSTFSSRIANLYGAPQGSRPAKFTAWPDQRDAIGIWKMFLVSRLDGPGAMIARGLVGKAIRAESELTLTGGKGYFDYQGTRGPSKWLTPSMKRSAMLPHAARARASGQLLAPQSAGRWRTRSVQEQGWIRAGAVARSR